MTYDAFLLVSFGGPEGPGDVWPFLRNVTRGRGVPEARLAEVAERYLRVGGVSPVNGQCRALLAALRAEFSASGIELPLYWGNRNWHPLLPDAVAAMRSDGVRRALAFVTSAYGSYPSCRQYLEDLAAARSAVGGGAPVIDKIRHFHDHPGFVEPHADAVRRCLARFEGQQTMVVFTAHSIPIADARASGGSDGRYVAQLHETAGLVAARAGAGANWDLAWQSRSGPPGVPWLAPDVNERLERLAGEGFANVVVSPIGFVSDHFEVLWDLDERAAATARRLGLGFARAGTPGDDPRFVAMIGELVAERFDPSPRRRKLGTIPSWDECPAECCQPRQ